MNRQEWGESLLELMIIFARADGEIAKEEFETIAGAAVSTP